MTTSNREFAPAKINLSLHVTGQNADGYHALDSLVVFSDIGDFLTAQPAETFGLSVTGPMGNGIPTDDSNLILKAAKFVNAAPHQFTLEKHLPMEAGIGGGSSDAAAALRLLWAPALDYAPLGADVPVCMAPSAQRMRGIGGDLTPINDFPPLPAILINPRVAVKTPEIFARLTQKQNPPMPQALPPLRTPAQVIEFLHHCRNDLQPPAIELAPQIADCIAALSQGGAAIARMSGSGATCFGIYETQAQADAAAEALKVPPHWWVQRTTLA